MFAPLNVKSVYSFLSSTINPKAYIDLAHDMNYEYVGLMDLGNLHAAYSFIKEAKKKGLKPVIGIELGLLLDGLPFDICFIAENTRGYKNLLKISTKYNYKRREFSEFTELLDGIALVLPQGFELDAPKIYTRIDLDSPKNLTSPYPLLPLPEINYLYRNEIETINLLSAIKSGSIVDESILYENTKYLKDRLAYSDYFSSHFPASLENLRELLAPINYDLESNLPLPNFNPQKEARLELREDAYAGLNEQLGRVDDSYKERLDYELSVIHKMGFDDYFLIVADILSYARNHSIYTGMGRGSAAGSLVAYALQITHVDPVRNNLLFERFLNPERNSMPDIDLDIPQDKREELLTYVDKRYGKGHTAQIVTYSTFGAKQSLRDVAKAYGLPDHEAISLTKLITGRDGLQEEYAKNNRLRDEIFRNPRLQKVYEMAQKIEGFPRQTSIHASGVILSEKNLTDYIPLAPGDNLAISQYDAHIVEEIGLLKIDFLGLRNLSLIEKMRDLVLERFRKKIDFTKIDLEDQEVLSLFREGNTMGIFQFENPQMLKMLRKLQPDSFNDIVSATSIFRPGPSQNIDSFIRRKHSLEKITYPDMSIAPILEPTYGIMIYQEQIIQIANIYAGFSLAKADLLRRAISKKNLKEIEALKEDFIEGAVKNGHSRDQALYIYELIEKFANYGFNKSHAYAYAALAVQLAYFKTYYKEVFYEVLLEDGKRDLYLKDARKNHLDFTRLSINDMPYYDKVAHGKIYLGLKNVKGVSRDLALHIINHRPYKDFSDFIKKLPDNFQKTAQINPLIQIGAFDLFDTNRRKLLENLPKLIDYSQTIQLDLFATTALSFSYMDYEDYSQLERYNFEAEILGAALTPHPLADIRASYKGEVTSIDSISEARDVSILVELISLREHKTKTGEKMAFLKVEDPTGDLDVTLFPENYRLYRKILEEGGVYLINGQVNTRNGNLQMVAQKIIKGFKSEKNLWLNVKDQSHNKQLATILREFPGFVPVIIHWQDSGMTKKLEITIEENVLLDKKLSPYILKAIYK
ncbi:DNA polymerase III subunit alpha [Streptococcaceae bacterium ESL0687]|nr:DNA polymerase III subunit alpha [Streptococcaceae bacterium ESL0687]